MATSIAHARIFDGETLLGATTVRLENSRVVGIGDESIIHSDDVIVEASGRTLLPGLIDAHVHLLPGAAIQALTFGVTTLLDMFSHPHLLDRERSITEELRSDVFSSSIGATAPGGHPSMMYGPFPTLDGPDGARLFVRARANEGARHLKVFHEGGQSIDWPMPCLAIETVQALVEAAHDIGLPVVAHVSRAADAVAVAGAGVDVLAHAPLDPLDPAQVAALVDAGVAVISTLSIADGFPAPGQRMPLLGHPGIGSLLGPRWSAVIDSQEKRWRPPGMPRFRDQRDNIRRLHEAGVAILAGTDAPNPGTVHGASLHRELWHLVQAGLSPIDALRAATSTPARIFCIPHAGRIQLGSAADLVLVAGQPDRQITASTAIEAVWRKGRIVQAEYVDSSAEAAGLAHLAEQTAQLMDRMSDSMQITKG